MQSITNPKVSCGFLISESHQFSIHLHIIRPKLRLQYENKEKREINIIYKIENTPLQVNNNTTKSRVALINICLRNILFQEEVCGSAVVEDCSAKIHFVEDCFVH